MASEEHDRLVELGARWFKRNGFPVIATEIMVVGCREQADVFGARSSASAIIEAKVSRADFLADRKKPERQSGGLGVYRFYLCPEGLISPDELPPRWGLLYARGRTVVDVVRPTGNIWPTYNPHPELAAVCQDWLAFQHEPDIAAERNVLFSIARRLAC